MIYTIVIEISAHLGCFCRSLLLKKSVMYCKKKCHVLSQALRSKPIPPDKNIKSQSRPPWSPQTAFTQLILQFRQHLMKEKYTMMWDLYPPVRKACMTLSSRKKDRVEHPSQQYVIHPEADNFGDDDTYSHIRVWSGRRRLFGGVFDNIGHNCVTFRKL